MGVRDPPWKGRPHEDRGQLLHDRLTSPQVSLSLLLACFTAQLLICPQTQVPLEPYLQDPGQSMTMSG